MYSNKGEKPKVYTHTWIRKPMQIHKHTEYTLVKKERKKDWNYICRDKVCQGQLIRTGHSQQKSWNKKERQHYQNSQQYNNPRNPLNNTFTSWRRRKTSD